MIHKRKYKPINWTSPKWKKKLYKSSDKIKWQWTEWDKLLASHKTDKELISRKWELLKLNSNKQMINNGKWVKGMNWHFSKRDMWIIHEQTKRCITSLAIRKIQMQTKIGFFINCYKRVKWHGHSGKYFLMD